MSSQSGILYLGVTNNLQRRVFEHKQGIVDSFSKKYKCNKIVYFEQYQDINEAIRREKQLKNWTRKKKEFLINKMNFTWQDLSEAWK